MITNLKLDSGFIFHCSTIFYIYQAYLKTILPIKLYYNRNRSLKIVIILCH